MRIEIAEHGRMTESGSSLLRLIQNQDMPMLDLLVREAVQNSLDASDGISPYVSVDISLGTFSKKELNKYFEKIGNVLNERFPDKKNPYKFISIRDSNTTGLTGPVRYEDVKDNQFGNLLKLVYEICKPQINEGSGGSWGLGKTIYFRIGIGLVIYYSRIKIDNGKYRSRMAACLVEDETKKESLIPDKGGVKRGIAWWGDSDGKNRTIPIENEREISRILSVFGITPYCGDHTGTTVIIPYIDEDKLLHEVYESNEDVSYKPYWTNKIEDYIPIALQRWYAPRILNRQYAYGSYLAPSVNGKSMRISEMLPLFRIVRELYIIATDGKLDNDSYILSSDAEYKVESVNLRGIFSPGSSSAGNFVFLKMDHAQLLMDPPDNNKSPYQQITNRIIPMDGGNTPIVMFTRKPGMIVGYDYNSSWTHRMPKSNENEYIIGLFVANSENHLKNIPNIITGKELTLEEYIRQGEKADHASWSDRNISGINPRIIAKVQNGVIKKISARYKEKSFDNTEKKNIGLGQALANILLPPFDFGKRSTQPYSPIPEPKDSVHLKHKSALSITSEPGFENNNVVVECEINLRNTKCILELLVATDYKKFSADLWEDKKEIGKKFPFSIVDFNLVSLRKKGEKDYEALDMHITEANSPFSDDCIEVNFIKSDRFGTISSVCLSAKYFCTVKGKITFSSEDSELKGIVMLREDNQ